MFSYFKKLVLFVIILLILVGCAGVDHKKYYADHYYDNSMFIQQLAADNSKLSQQEFLDAAKLAEQGDAKAQFLIGRSYLIGSPVIADLVKASYWVRKSAEQGDPDGQRLLGSLY